MLNELRLINFRCFKDFTIDFDKFNIIVGRNNAGKSTVIDALKLVSNVRRFASYRDAYLKDKDIPFSLTNIRHDYNETETIIRSKFTDMSEIEIIFPFEGSPYANFSWSKHEIVDRSARRRYFKDSMGFVPPVSTFEEFEVLGDKRYLQSIMISHLTARHFRNIWYYFMDDFDEFKEIIERTWPGCSVEAPEFNTSENRVNMFFKENGITREIFWSGHGFQVWLQLMTSLVKLGPKDTLILDEPDIYLHSDMQKKLVNICKTRSNQVIIATHAVDIIEEVSPEDIISIDKNSNWSSRLSDINEVQTCITQLGSVQNLKLVHFTRGKTCLFVEGKDFPYLKILARTLNCDSFANEDGFSVIPLDGSSNWERLLYVGWIFKNAFGEPVKCYVILDRDYHTYEEIQHIVSQLERKSVKIHIWSRKEIENYLIDYDVLYRLFNIKLSKRYKADEVALSKVKFIENISLIMESFKNEISANIINRRVQSRPDRKIDESTVTLEVLNELQNNWFDLEYRKSVIPGKNFFAKLNTWLNDVYHITIPVYYAFQSLETDEIDAEIRGVIEEFTGLVASK